MTDSAVADQADTDRPTRRALLGAGVIGAAIATAGSPSANAATSGLSEGDAALVGFAISLELTARDLYDAAIDAGPPGELWGVLREQHESYAQRLAGIAGLPADQRDDAIYDSQLAGFTGATKAAAFELENGAAATHIELLGVATDNNLAKAIAAIVAVESRHAAHLAEGAGMGDDLDALFLNPATAPSPEA